VIDGLVLGQISPQGNYYVIDKPTAIKWAYRSLLWTRIPSDGRIVDVIPVDSDGDGYFDYVRTAPDSTYRNNLLDHPIWDRVRRIWVSPDEGVAIAAP
jgi:hypothetical protein